MFLSNHKFILLCKDRIKRHTEFHIDPQCRLQHKEST